MIAKIDYFKSERKFIKDFDSSYCPEEKEMRLDYVIGFLEKEKDFLQEMLNKHYYKPKETRRRIDQLEQAIAILRNVGKGAIK